MGDSTGIGWTQRTWNPWMGCAKVSPGCDNCYMFKEQERYGTDPELIRRSKTTFRKPLSKAWRDPAMVFTCSWSDWFIKEADAWRDEAWEIIRQTPHLTYQILTKRHARIVKNLPNVWPLPNVWLGVTAEDDLTMRQRVPFLAKVPGDFVRFVSMEPLIERVSLTAQKLRAWKTDWVIVGGESQPGCRPMDLDWAREIRDACVEADVALYLKQLGGHPDPRSGHAAVLDGRTWTQFPARHRQ